MRRKGAIVEWHNAATTRLPPAHHGPNDARHAQCNPGRAFADTSSGDKLVSAIMERIPSTRRRQDDPSRVGTRNRSRHRCRTPSGLGACPEQ